MKHQFLCATHRQELGANPTQALRCWRNGYEAGQTFIDMGCHYDALPHLGCAFEVAEIILTKQMLETYDAIVLFTTSAATLAKCLTKRGYQNQRESVIQLTIGRLSRELALHPELTAIIRHQIHALEFFTQEEDKPSMEAVAASPQLVSQSYFEQLEQRVLH